jgi:K+-sensing histidine kinase KdpD
MKQQINSTDLNTMIMSVVHDSKNSLLLSSSTLECVIPLLPTELQNKLNKVQTEISAVNQSLMRMLTLYKMQTDIFSLNRDQYNVYDFLEEISIINGSLFVSNERHIDIDCDEDINWFIDYDLLSNAINTVLNNTIRYAKKNILLKATIEDNLLVIKIIDDGDGYPDNMIKSKEKIKTQVDFKMSHSGLGLFFAETIAKLHDNKGRNGFTKITNLASGGGCFTLFLP